MCHVERPSGCRRTLARLDVGEPAQSTGQLLRARKIREEISLALAPRPVAAELANQAGMGVRVTSQAAVPAAPTQLQRALNVVLAGGLCGRILAAVEKG
jgi:hypothetical protein